jgi:hypothetical protein
VSSEGFLNRIPYPNSAPKEICQFQYQTPYSRRQKTRLLTTTKLDVYGQGQISAALLTIIMGPSIPEQAHPSTHITHSMDLEEPDGQRRKRAIITMEDGRVEWRTGSKKRVIKYYAVWAAIEIVVGAIIGIVVGDCVRFVRK